MNKKIDRPMASPSNTLPHDFTPDRHNLKYFKVDLPTTVVANFTLLAESEAEAVELINAAIGGNQDAMNRVDIHYSAPVYSPVRIQRAELGTSEEKRLLREVAYPLHANIVMGVQDEN